MLSPADAAELVREGREFLRELRQFLGALRSLQPILLASIISGQRSNGGGLGGMIASVLQAANEQKPQGGGT